MRDYAELILDLRRHHCDAKDDDTQEVCEECAYDVIVSDKSKFNGITDVCTCGLMHRAADAIEELLAAEPPSLWTDEPIEGTEFMTHSQGGRKGFEIHFRTDSLEKYKAVQEECRRQIGHSKPEPPKGVE